MPEEDNDHCPTCGIGVTVVLCANCNSTVCSECGAVWEDEE